MKAFVYMLVGVLFLTACRTSKMERNAYKQSEEISEAVSLRHTKDVQGWQSIDETLQRAINERFNLTLKQNVYDTSQPTDTATGKHPVLVETRIEIKKETETTDKSQMQTQTDIVENTQTEAAKLAEGKTDTAAEHEATRWSGFYNCLWVAGLVLAFVGLIWYLLKRPKL